MDGYVLSQLNPRSSTILALKKAEDFGLGLFKAKNVEFLGLYPILNTYVLGL